MCSTYASYCLKNPSPKASPGKNTDELDEVVPVIERRVARLICLISLDHRESIGQVRAPRR